MLLSQDFAFQFTKQVVGGRGEPTNGFLSNNHSVSGVPLELNFLIFEKHCGSGWMTVFMKHHTCVSVV